MVGDYLVHLSVCPVRGQIPVWKGQLLCIWLIMHVLFRVLGSFKDETRAESRGTMTRGSWLAQSTEHVTLGLGMVTSSIILGIEIILEKKNNFFKKRGNTTMIYEHISIKILHLKGES